MQQPTEVDFEEVQHTIIGRFLSPIEESANTSSVTTNGFFNHRMVTMVADNLMRQWLIW